MSVVTNIILTCSTVEADNDDMDAPPIRALNAWLAEHRHAPLKDIGAHAGGDKHMEALVFGGAYNYLDLQSFLDYANAQAWEAPQDVRIFAQEQQADHFSAYALGGAGARRIGD